MFAKQKVSGTSLLLGYGSKDIVVYRSPTCGCCSKWLTHLEAHGFNVQDNETDDIQKIKDKYAINRSLASCYTAIINGYIVEGR